MSCSISWPLRCALRAVIGGADQRTEVVEFGQSRQAWFATFLKRPSGIASHDTFARVFRLVNAQALENACHQWLASLVGRVSGVVAMDGKSVRGARDGSKHPLLQQSAPGPANTPCCSDKSAWRKSPMKSPPFPSYSSA
jgi:hypothetical protein